MYSYCHKQSLGGSYDYLDHYSHKFDNSSQTVSPWIISSCHRQIKPTPFPQIARAPEYVVLGWWAISPTIMRVSIVYLWHNKTCWHRAGDNDSLGNNWIRICDTNQGSLLSMLIISLLSRLVWNTILYINLLRPRQRDCNFPDDIFKCIFLNENVWISLKISLMFLHKVRVDNIPALVQLMARCRSGDKSLS